MKQAFQAEIGPYERAMRNECTVIAVRISSFLSLLSSLALTLFSLFSSNA
jgi:hypothetical protein